VEELGVGSCRELEEQFDEDGEPYGGEGDVVTLDYKDVDVLKAYLAKHDYSNKKKREQLLLWNCPGITIYGLHEDGTRFPEPKKDEAYKELMTFEEFIPLLEKSTGLGV
uniref:hypothetical protein n=1 Tax=Streptomyces brasiliscabiei TaxID=2736302 RepID=UPI001C124EB0